MHTYTHTQHTQVIIQEPTGRLKKDVHAILYKCGIVISEHNLRVLNDAFRPFSDPVYTISGGPLALTRTFMREAIRKRYMIASVSLGDMDTRLQDYRISADAQVMAVVCIYASIVM